MQKINLLYVITALELGGAQKQLLSIISNLDKERFNIFLFCAQDGLILPAAFSIDGLVLRRSRWLDRPINPFKDLLALFEIYWFIKKNNIKIIHTHSSKAGILGRLAARLAKVKFICHTVHGWSFNDLQSFLFRKLFIELERFTARFTDRLIVVSGHDKQKGLANGIGQEGKYCLIRYGIDYAEFSLRDPDIRKELGINQNDLVVGTVSCLKPQKAPEDFIKLAALVNKILPEVKFLLVGDGLLRRHIQKLINKFNLNKNVILVGWRQDVHRILSAIDVFALTSLWEGSPIAVLEAVTASIPVVATHTGGIAELIDNGRTGFLVPLRDMQSMSEKTILLLKDKTLRKQVASNAKNNLGGNFTLQGMVEKTQDLYEEFI
jgi:glycosyltransferase involved in cell wall biosynthesis